MGLYLTQFDYEAEQEFAESKFIRLSSLRNILDLFR